MPQPAKYVNSGQMVEDTSPTAVSVGTVVIVNDLVGVAVHPLVANVLGALAVKGTFDIAKGTGAITGGSKIYWDATNGVATTSTNSGANKYVGKATFAGAASGDATVRVVVLP